MFTFSGETIAIMLIVYGFIASALPVWMLLAPRDYLSIFKSRNNCRVSNRYLNCSTRFTNASSFEFIDGTGPVFSGNLFPFLFITIACGAVSGFHALVSSGTTPKTIEQEGHAQPIGYGAMLMESFVARWR